jgi:lysophospholipase L1-like esterase
MKKLFYIILAGTVVLLGYRIFFSTSAENDTVSIGDTIICFGDSLTAGTGASKGKDYPSQLSKLISKPVINAGVPGDTTARALIRLDQDVLSRLPDMVLITLGGNDLKNGTSKDVAFENLKKIVESIQNQGARVIVGGLKFPLRDRGFGKGYEELSDQTGAILIPNILEDVIGNRKLMSDPIHPNDAGYKVIAERFFEAMRP